MTEPEQVVCPKCGGTGVRDEYDWSEKGQRWDCPNCNGRGKVGGPQAQQDWQPLGEEELSSISHHWRERAAHDIGDQDANESVLRLIATIRALQAQVITERDSAGKFAKALAEIMAMYQHTDTSDCAYRMFVIADDALFEQQKALNDIPLTKQEQGGEVG